MTKQVIVVGRGHSGTRAIAKTLHESGFHMGELNDSYDFFRQRQAMYDAVRECGALVRQSGGYAWDFKSAIQTEPTPEYRALVTEYLKDLQGHDPIAWKLPESVLALPWLVKVFPDAYYIHWVRDGRDNILKWHGTEDMATYNVQAPRSSNRLHNAAVSWKYHEDLTEVTPKPGHWLTVRFEDFVLQQSATIDVLSAYLDCTLSKIDVFADRIGQWQDRKDEVRPWLPIMQRHLKRHGYI